MYEWALLDLWLHTTNLGLNATYYWIGQKNREQTEYTEEVTEEGIIHAQHQHRIAYAWMQTTTIVQTILETLLNEVDDPALLSSAYWAKLVALFNPPPPHHSSSSREPLLPLDDLPDFEPELLPLLDFVDQEWLELELQDGWGLWFHSEWGFFVGRLVGLLVLPALFQTGFLVGRLVGLLVGRSDVGSAPICVGSYIGKGKRWLLEEDVTNNQV